jgi:hypothetical protein
MRASSGFLLLAGCAAVAWVSWSERQASAEYAAQHSIRAAVREYWSPVWKLYHLGALEIKTFVDEPAVEFIEDAAEFAVTECVGEPSIIFDRERSSKDPEFAVLFAVPHELAHVLVCLDRDVQGWKDGHGESWERWLAMIADDETARAVMEFEATVTRERQ